MIMKGNRSAVVERIEQNVKLGMFNKKVEGNDPVLSSEEEKYILEKFSKNRKLFLFKFKEIIARSFMNLMTISFGNNIDIIGLNNIRTMKSGCIITSNHFSPLENLAIRKMILKSQLKRVNIVSQATNLKMKGALGFLMKYDFILPIGKSISYQNNVFLPMLAEEIGKGNNILIYPEQEMWFNYRKPRPLKRGAYYYACKLHVPVIPCFVKIEVLHKKENALFYKTKYILYILDPIYPGKNKNIRAASIEMMHRDYQAKVDAYEKAYGKKLDYKFDYDDIAGYIPSEPVSLETI